MNRALLVGINAYPDAPLCGCVNDIADMADFLVAYCGFAEAEIRLLADKRATTSAILDRLAWLLQTLHAKVSRTLPLSKLVPRVRAALKKAGFEQEPQLEGTTEWHGRPFLSLKC